MKGRFLLVLLSALLFGGCKTAPLPREAVDAEELPFGRIEEAVSLVREGEYEKARNLLRGVHNEYTSKDWYSVGFYDKQRLYLYLALCETLLGNSGEAGEALGLAFRVENVMWGTSWDSAAREFVRSTTALAAGWTEEQRSDWRAMLTEITGFMGE